MLRYSVVQCRKADPPRVRQHWEDKKGSSKQLEKKGTYTIISIARELCVLFMHSPSAEQSVFWSGSRS
jgi:hypothetical protein